MNELIYCDVIEELKKEIAEIKLRISALIQEKEELEYHICPELKADYYEKIGKIEVNIRMLELTADELKYRISILQAAINRREKVSEEKVEEKVEEKYSEYRKKYEEAYEKAQEEQKEQEDHQKRKQENREKYEKDKGAEHKDDKTGKDASSGDDEKGSTNDRDGDKGAQDDSYKKMSYSQKIKELYRRIVKKLHPDINPNITEHEKELFYETQKAYKDGDLEKLEEIYEEITSGDSEVGKNSSADDIERLKEIKEKLLKKIEALEKEITAIKCSFPYSEKDMLSDPEALAARQEELNSIIETYKEIVAELTEIYNKLKDELYNPKDKNSAKDNDTAGASSDENKDATAATESTEEPDDLAKNKKADEPEEFWE